MHKQKALSFLTLLAFLILAPQVAFCADPPISVNGYLEDSDGIPMEGVYAWEIQIFSTPSTSTQIGVPLTGATTVTLGVFNIPLSLPSTTILNSEFWLSLAIDTEKDGIDPSDLFEDLFHIGPVPFALSAKPTPYYTTHGGHIAAGTMIYLGPYTPNMYVSPFCTPAGGVKFNRMAGIFTNIRYPGGTDPSADARISFGIYDSKGKAVALSGPILVAKDYSGIVEVAIEGNLLPSEVYYVGWGANQPGIFIRPTLTMATAGYGKFTDVVQNGVIPSSFDPNGLGTLHNLGISLTLRYVPENPGGERPATRAARGAKAQNPKVTFIPFPKDNDIDTLR